MRWWCAWDFLTVNILSWSGLKLKQLIDASKNYSAVLAENRKLYNEVQDLKGTIFSLYFFSQVCLVKKLEMIDFFTNFYEKFGLKMCDLVRCSPSFPLFHGKNSYPSPKNWIPCKSQKSNRTCHQITLFFQLIKISWVSIIFQLFFYIKSTLSVFFWVQHFVAHMYYFSAG